MGLGDFHRHRRLASIFALVGILLYSALIPGHVVSQATALVVAGTETSLEADLQIICHGGGLARTQNPSRPGEPATPQKKCPFCAGYAAFVTGVAISCDTAILDAERVSPRLVVFNERLVESAVTHPQNRGPPLEL